MNPIENVELIDRSIEVDHDCRKRYENEEAIEQFQNRFEFDERNFQIEL